MILTSAGLILASQCLGDSNLADLAIDDLVLRAQSALAKGQSHQAAELYEKAAGLGESAEAEIGLVRAYLQAGEFRKTIAFGNLVAVEHPDVSETTALLAYLEDREGQTAPALTKLGEALKTHPSDVALMGAYAEILIDRLAIPQAMRELDDWIAKNPPQGDIYRLRARAALAAGNVGEVVNWREKAALAYEANGEWEAAKHLRDWLSHQSGISQSKNSGRNSASQTKATATPKNTTAKVLHWPAPFFASFPLSSGNSIKSGNGFIIDRGRRVVTYASLVSNAHKDILIRNGLGEIRSSRVEKILPDQGLALLRLAKAYPKKWSLPSLPLRVPEGVKFCFVFGYPVTDSLEAGYPLLAPGSVVRANVGYGGLMQVTGSLGPDNSGSPVFDSSGKFIGMTLGKQEQIKGITDKESLLGKGTFALRADVLQGLLPKSSKLRNKPAKTRVEELNPSVEELYEKLQPAVVSIVVPN